MKISTVNPATGEIIKSYELFSAEKINNLLKKSDEGFKRWKSFSAEERAHYIKKIGSNLTKNKNKLSRLITEEMGKTVRESIAEIEKCAWLCDYFSRNASKFLQEEIIMTENRKSYVRFDPLGKILGIMPWNFPFWQVMRFSIPALCAGNSVILKHSGITTGCSIEIERIFNEYLEEGIFQSVLTDSRGIKNIMPKVNGVSLTGSVETGKKIGVLAGSNIKKLVLELGGSDPFIVLDDADLGNVYMNAVKARTINSGQSCIAAKRFIVVNKRFNEFSDNIIKIISGLKVGDPMDIKTDIGPLARKNFVLKLDNQIKKAMKKGAKILYQGNEKFERGYYFNPVVLGSRGSFGEETFGPVFELIKVKNNREAIREANKTNFGLGASLWTKNIKIAEAYAKEIEAGAVFVNDIVKSDPRLPFGGVKDSGFGRELSRYGILEFCNIKTVVVK